MHNIDWRPLLKYKENVVECKCGAVYRSHTKGVWVEGRFAVISRKPCPACGKVNNVKRSTSPPETLIL